jgi:hypothetical protein
MAFEMSESGVSAVTTSDLHEKQQKGIREMCRDRPLFRSMLNDSKGPKQLMITAGLMATPVSFRHSPCRKTNWCAFSLTRIWSRKRFVL